MLMGNQFNPLSCKRNNWYKLVLSDKDSEGPIICMLSPAGSKRDELIGGQPSLDNRFNGLMYSLSTIIRTKSVLEETGRAWESDRSKECPLKASVVMNPSAVYLQCGIQTSKHNPNRLDLTWTDSTWNRLNMKQTWRGMKQTRLTDSR